MLTPDTLHDYQHASIQHVLNNPRAMLWLEMSLGKTVITLSAISELIDRLDVFGALVLGPKRVVQSVWRQEGAEWAHLRHLRFALLRGSEAQRLAALNSKADIYLANYEMARWLVEAVNRCFLQRRRRPPFNMAVFDEVSRVKNSTGKRAQDLYAMMPYCDYRVGLTGTPASNGYRDLHGQYLMIDDGERLFQHKTRFQETFMRPASQGGFMARKQLLANGAAERIKDKIKDITFSLRAKDVLKLPAVHDNDVYIELPPKLQETYEQFENEMFFKLDEEEAQGIEVFNAAALTNKCRQFANGRVYIPDTENEVLDVHDLKMQILDEVLEEAAGKPVLLAYAYRIDLYRIMETYSKRKDMSLAYLGPGVSDKESETVVERWNDGQYTLLCTHPASAGHGLNMQFGGNHIVWYGLDWNLEYYEQMIARLARQRQRESFVINTRIMCKDTIEMAVRDALARKAGDQDGLKDSLKRAVKAYRSYKQGLTGQLAA